MAITITQERKKQRRLFLVLALVVFAAFLVVWFGFFRSKNIVSPEIPAPAYVFPKVSVDWQLLENIRGQKLQPVEQISAFEGQFGRNNPFIPY